MPATLNQPDRFLVHLGIVQIAHTQKNYLAHLFDSLPTDPCGQLTLTP